MDSNIIGYSPLFDMDSAASVFRDAFDRLKEMAQPNCEMYGDEEHCTGKPAVSIAQMMSAIRMACRDDLVDSVDRGVDNLVV